VNSIRDATVALDTNVFVFALRKDASYPACGTLVFDKLHELKVYVPLQILAELQRNLTSDEMRGILRALIRAKTVTWDYAPAPVELITRREQMGAKKGDAVIAAHLEAANIRYFVSENRHFLAELPALPFRVLSRDRGPSASKKARAKATFSSCFDLESQVFDHPVPLRGLLTRRREVTVHKD
jgi:hypothetical protein